MTEAIEITLDDQQKQRISDAAMALNRERYGFNIEHFIVDAVMHYVERIEDRMDS
jgi:predicted transcriptional regulator